MPTGNRPTRVRGFINPDPNNQLGAMTNFFAALEAERQRERERARAALNTLTDNPPPQPPMPQQPVPVQGVEFQAHAFPPGMGHTYTEIRPTRAVQGGDPAVHPVYYTPPGPIGDEPEPNWGAPPATPYKTLESLDVECDGNSVAPPCVQYLEHSCKIRMMAGRGDEPPSQLPITSFVPANRKKWKSPSLVRLRSMIDYDRHSLTYLAERFIERHTHNIMFSQQKWKRLCKYRANAEPCFISRAARESIDKLPKLKAFLESIHYEKWKFRSDREDFTIAGTSSGKREELHSGFRGRSHSENKSFVAVFCARLLNDELSHAASINDYTEDVSDLFINKILYIYKINNLLKKKEYIEMKNICPITGMPLKPGNHKEIKIFKLWRYLHKSEKGNTYRSRFAGKDVNVIRDYSNYVTLIPVYDLSKGDYDLDAGRFDSPPVGQTTFEYIAEMQRMFGADAGGIGLVQITTQAFNQMVAVLGVERLWNDTFIRSTQDRQGIKTYQCGCIQPLPYSTHPEYGTARIPRSAKHAYFGLEIEVKSKYTREYAVRDKDGNCLSPEQVLRKMNWAITKDSSVEGFELKSPIITDNIKWDDQIPDSIKNLIDTTAKDVRCGGHIHMSTTDRVRTYVQFQNWAWLFGLIYPLRINNRYCHINLKGFGQDSHEKYQWLRLRRETVEFRIFPAVRNCKGIYWRLNLLKKLHAVNLEHDPKTCAQTVTTFMLDSESSNELRRHIFSARPAASLLNVLKDAAWSQLMEERFVSMTYEGQARHDIPLSSDNREVVKVFLQDRINRKREIVAAPEDVS